MQIKKVIIWDKHVCSHNWNSDLRNVMQQIGAQHAFENNKPVYVNNAEL